MWRLEKKQLIYSYINTFVI